MTRSNLRQPTDAEAAALAEEFPEHVRARGVCELAAIVGGNIRARRMAADLTPADLGRAMGLGPDSSRMSVWRWERGQRLSLETVERLAYALNSDPADLCRQTAP